MSLQKPDYKKWRHVNTFTCLQAAYLWLDIEPQPETVDPPEVVKSLLEDLIGEKIYYLEEEGKNCENIASLRLHRSELNKRWDDLKKGDIVDLNDFNMQFFGYKLDLSPSNSLNCPKFLYYTGGISPPVNSEESEKDDKPAAKSAITTIRILKDLILNGFVDDDGKKVEPTFGDQTQLINYITDKYAVFKGKGVSDRTLKGLFAEANKVDFS